MLVALAAVGGVVLVRSGEAEPVFCTVEGLIGANGEMYGRTGPDCRFVNGDGKTLTTLAGGQPLCYGDVELMSIAPCGRPGVTRAEDL